MERKEMQPIQQVFYAKLYLRERSVFIQQVYIIE